MQVVGQANRVVLQVGPVLSVQEVPELCRIVNRLAERGGVQAVLDLSTVVSIDPLGVLGLLGWRQQLVASGGELAIYRPQPSVAAALDLFYVSRQLTHTDTLPEPLTPLDV